MSTWVKKLVAYAAVVAGSLLIAVGCGEAPVTAPRITTDTRGGKPESSQSAQAQGWGTIVGRVVFGGDKIPENAPLNVDKDTAHCLSKGPLFSQKWVVDPQSKGVRYAVVFLKAARGKPLPIHDSLKEPNVKEVALDQPTCAFEPHVLGIRQGQKLISKNPAPVPHNVMFSGIRNTNNVQIPPGGEHTFELFAESTPVKISCGAHPWMEGFAWIFEHPYFAVTDASGRFEIKLAPAGPQSFVLWQESIGFEPDQKGRPIEVKADGVTDLGDIAIKPKQ
jgi:hypothetical protein